MIKELNSPELPTFRMVNTVTVCPHFKLSFMCDYDRENGFLDYLMVHSSELHEKKMTVYQQAQLLATFSTNEQVRVLEE